MILEHYSATPITEVYSKDQLETIGTYVKPQGLWVSVKGEDDWPSWCHREDFASDRRAVVHEVNLTPKAKILLLEGAKALDDFTSKYGVTDPLYSSIPGLNKKRWWAIKWPDVAKEYQGIIIAPYVWERRLYDKTTWYYGWDCASGCIWDKDAIQSIRVIRNKQKEG